MTTTNKTATAAGRSKVGDHYCPRRPSTLLRRNNVANHSTSHRKNATSPKALNSPAQQEDAKIW